MYVQPTYETTSNIHVKFEISCNYSRIYSHLEANFIPTKSYLAYTFQGLGGSNKLAQATKLILRIPTIASIIITPRYRQYTLLNENYIHP